jgi:hypothetical protein
MSRRKIPAVRRIQEHLDVNILTKNPDKDAHWIWRGKLPPKERRKVLGKLKKPMVREGIQVPPRIKDDDGVRRSVSRILYEHFFGTEYPYHLRRAMGCDYTCVNPYHMDHPKSEFDDVEVKEISEDDEIEGLADDLGEFIAANGRSYDRILERFGLDYTEEEIQLALRKLES